MCGVVGMCVLIHILLTVPEVELALNWPAQQAHVAGPSLHIHGRWGVACVSLCLDMDCNRFMLVTHNVSNRHCLCWNLVCLNCSAQLSLRWSLLAGKLHLLVPGLTECYVLDGCSVPDNCYKLSLCFLTGFHRPCFCVWANMTCVMFWCSLIQIWFVTNCTGLDLAVTWKTYKFVLKVSLYIAAFICLPVRQQDLGFVWADILGPGHS